jgi:LPPG:FO 2-phospho-L-lactate transferase
LRRHILAVAGGVGGAKLAFGLSRLLAPQELTIVVNTGDDEEFHGLHVSPDLDTVMYTLAGLANSETGWGRRDESFTVLEELGRLGADTWFGLGDRDLALHIRRADLLRQGNSLSGVTATLSEKLGVRHPIVPMTHAPVRTVVDTQLGRMPFQEYFVKHRCEPRVLGLTFEGAAQSALSPGFVRALEEATAVVFCPSNPFLSIGPVLALPDVRQRLLADASRPRVIVSPIIAGEAVKGPAARLFQELAGEAASCVAVARRYRGLGTHFVLDLLDAKREVEIEAMGYRTLVAQTMMTSDERKVGLAGSILEWLEGGD